MDNPPLQQTPSLEDVQSTCLYSIYTPLVLEEVPLHMSIQEGRCVSVHKAQDQTQAQLVTEKVNCQLLLMPTLFWVAFFPIIFLVAKSNFTQNEHILPFQHYDK